MSQITNGRTIIAPGTYVETLTANSGGAVSADVTGNINVLGDTTTINITGNPGTNTLTANVTGGTNGQLLIAATAGNPTWAALTSTDGSVVYTAGANSLNLSVDAAASGAVISLTTDDLNVVVPTGAGNINLVGAHGLNTSGAVANTASVQINNAITLGDLSNIAADTDALTITTGDITFSATNNVGNIHIPGTHSSGNAGVITAITNTTGTRGIIVNTYNPNATYANLFLAGGGNLSLTTATRNYSIAGLSSLTTGSRNISMGESAGASITSTTLNTMLGSEAGFPFDGSANTFIGGECGGRAASGIGGATGTSNISIGAYSTNLMTSGSYNTVIGSGEVLSGDRHAAGTRLTTGSQNILIGSATGSGTGGAGYNYTGAESSNICIGNATIGTTGESNVMRLGTSGSGSGQVNKCYLAGVDGVNVGSVAKVLTMASDQVGTATITAGTNITVTPGANTITIASTAVAFTWAVTTIDASIVVNNGYIANKAGLLTMTLPATAAVGDTIAITNINTAVGWRIAQNANQKINVGSSSTTVGIAGYVEATALGDTVTLVCIVGGASTFWQATSLVGNLTIN